MQQFELFAAYRSSRNGLYLSFKSSVFSDCAIQLGPISTIKLKKSIPENLPAEWKPSENKMNLFYLYFMVRRNFHPQRRLKFKGWARKKTKVDPKAEISLQLSGILGVRRTFREFD